MMTPRNGSKLDEHQKQIREWLKLGLPKTRIARRLSVNPSSLYYFLKTRGIEPECSKPGESPDPLIAEAERIVSNITHELSTEVYRLCSREMEWIEHEGLWLGNGHHAAQRMQAKVMKQLKPLLKTVIQAEVLR